MTIVHDETATSSVAPETALEERVQWAPGIEIYRRTATSVSLGADTTRAVLIESADAHALVPALRNLHRPMPRSAAVQSLCTPALGDAQLRPAHARNLIAELLHAGALRCLPPQPDTPPPPELLLLGSGTLADTVNTMLKSAGITPLRPAAEDSVPHFLAQAEAATPVIAVGMLGDAGPLSRWLLPRHGTSVSVDIVDNQGRIGPLRRNAHGPCLLCVALHHVDAEPRWHAVMRQTSTLSNPDAEIPHHDPAVLAMTAAQATACARELVGLPRPYTGLQGGGTTTSVGTALAVGTMLTIDPYAEHSVRRDSVGQHPRCPWCFASRGRQNYLSDIELQERARGVRNASYRLAQTISQLDGAETPEPC